MNRYVAALLAVGLVAGASAARAQQAPKHEEMKGTHHAMAGHTANEHTAMMRLQASAIRDAQAAEKLAAEAKPNHKLLVRDANRSHDDLQKVLKHLQDAEGAASGEMKEDITKARGHEEEALKHADELVTAAQAHPLDAAAVKTHADAVVEHARLAEDVMKAHHEKEEGEAKEKGEAKAKSK